MNVFVPIYQVISFGKTYTIPKLITYVVCLKSNQRNLVDTFFI